MAPEAAADVINQAGNFVANNAFPAFVAVWFMYKTNGKFDRLAGAMKLLTRVTILSLKECDEMTKQQLLKEVDDV